MVWICRRICCAVMMMHMCCSSARGSYHDPLWLRYTLIPDPSPYTSIKLISIVSASKLCVNADLAALHGLGEGEVVLSCLFPIGTRPARDVGPM